MMDLSFVPFELLGEIGSVLAEKVQCFGSRKGCLPVMAVCKALLRGRAPSACCSQTLKPCFKILTCSKAQTRCFYVDS